MSFSTPTSAPLTMSSRARVFPTLESFNENYAGPDTALLEKKARDLAGRQDDFCIICGNHADQLFPQTSPGEIHLCPRQLCSSCWHIEAGWKRDSPTKRRSLKVGDGKDNVVICCPLCWKRGWDFSSPLLGPDQPEWETVDQFSQRRAEILALRYKNWERAANTQVFSWRTPLLKLKDDMSMECDRDLLQGMLKKFQKNPKRFKLFDPQPLVEAASGNERFNLTDAFREHCDKLTNSLASDLLDEEVIEEPIVKPKRGPGRPPKKKKKTRPSWYMIEEPISPATDHTAQQNLGLKSATPDTGGRPKRQAARLSFASGKPVQRTNAEVNQDPSEEPETPRSLNTRVRKIVTLPVSLQASPESKKDIVEPASSHDAQLDSMDFEVTTPSLTSNVRPALRISSQEFATNGVSTEPAAAGRVEVLFQNGIQTQNEVSSGTSAPENLAPQNHLILQDTNNNFLLQQQDTGIAKIMELEAKYSALEHEHELLGTKYRRWRSGVVENAKLLFDQEHDITAKKDTITENSKTISQLSSDNAKLGAELALARGMVQYNPALLRQSFLRGSLTVEVVDRLFNNPDFMQLMAPRPANGEVAHIPMPMPISMSMPIPIPIPTNQVQVQALAPDSTPRPKKRRRITTSNDAEAEEARQKKLSRVIAPTIKRLEKSGFKLSASSIESVFDADTAESKRFLDSLIDFAKLPITFEEALPLIVEAQQDRRQGRVIVPQLRLSDPAWAPWDVKTAQKRYMARNGLSENDAGEIVTKMPKSMEDMVADARAVREAASRSQQQQQPAAAVTAAAVEMDESTMLSDNESSELMPSANHVRTGSASRRGGRSETEFRRVWERHEELRREREMREQEEQRAREPPLDMTDPLQALAASMFTSVNGSGNKGKGRAAMTNGSPRGYRGYQRREPSEDGSMEGGEDDEQPMELSESP